FGADVMEVVASWTKALCVDISQGGIPNHVDDVKAEASDLGNKVLSNWSVLHIRTGNGFLLQELAKQGMVFLVMFCTFSNICCIILLYKKREKKDFVKVSKFLNYYLL
ncbi:hypothetical protein HN51_023436, partial [Arachis hypogaea]